MDSPPAPLNGASRYQEVLSFPDFDMIFQSYLRGVTVFPTTHDGQFRRDFYKQGNLTPCHNCRDTILFTEFSSIDEDVEVPMSR